MPLLVTNTCIKPLAGRHATCCCLRGRSSGRLPRVLQAGAHAAVSNAIDDGPPDVPAADRSELFLLRTIPSKYHIVTALLTITFSTARRFSNL